MELPPNTELVREVPMTDADLTNHESVVVASDALNAQLLITQQLHQEHRAAMKATARHIAEREALGGPEEMQAAGLMLDVDAKRGTILILRKLAPVAVMLALLVLAGCGHGHSQDKEAAEPQMAPYLPPHVAPANG